MNKTKRSGQSIVEFVLVLPLFLLVVLFILDIGRAVFIYSGMTHAIKEGARLGVVNCNATDIQNKVNDMATFPIEVFSDCDDTDTEGFKRVIVWADYEFTAATPFIQNLFLNNEIWIHAESTMHREFLD